MKYYFLILTLFVTLQGFSQSHYPNQEDLTIFTSPFSVTKPNDERFQRICIDSIITVKKGISVEVKLVKETALWDSQNIQFVRFFKEKKPFGEWKYYSKNGDLLYSLNHHKQFSILELHNKSNPITCLRKYSSIENLEQSDFVEQVVTKEGVVLATGNRTPTQVFEQPELHKSGEWKFYFPTGVLESNGNYLNDKKEGKWKFFDQFGKKIRVVKFKNGVLTSQKEFK